jgi:hypothetical protein
VYIKELQKADSIQTGELAVPVLTDLLLTLIFNSDSATKKKLSGMIG